jgi:hypothetical protein
MMAHVLDGHIKTLSLIGFKMLSHVLMFGLGIAAGIITFYIFYSDIIKGYHEAKQEAESLRRVLNKK